MVKASADLGDQPNIAIRHTGDINVSASTYDDAYIVTDKSDNVLGTDQYSAIGNGDGLNLQQLVDNDIAVPAFVTRAEAGTSVLPLSAPFLVGQNIPVDYINSAGPVSVNVTAATIPGAHQVEFAIDTPEIPSGGTAARVQVFQGAVWNNADSVDSTAAGSITFLWEAITPAPGDPWRMLDATAVQFANFQQVSPSTRTGVIA